MPTINLDDETAKFPQLHWNVHPSSFSPQQMPPSIVSPFGMHGIHFSLSTFFTPSPSGFQVQSFGLNENCHPGNFLNLPSNGMQAPGTLQKKKHKKATVQGLRSAAKETRKSALKYSLSLKGHLIQHQLSAFCLYSHQ